MISLFTFPFLHFPTWRIFASSQNENKQTANITRWTFYFLFALIGLHLFDSWDGGQFGGWSLKTVASGQAHFLSLPPPFFPALFSLLPQKMSRLAGYDPLHCRSFIAKTSLEKFTAKVRRTSYNFTSGKNSRSSYLANYYTYWKTLFVTKSSFNVYLYSAKISISMVSSVPTWAVTLIFVSKNYVFVNNDNLIEEIPTGSSWITAAAVSCSPASGSFAVETSGSSARSSVTHPHIHSGYRIPHTISTNQSILSISWNCKHFEFGRSQMW